MKNAGSIGGGIFLFVVGAILAFALQVELGAVDIDLIGYIAMAAGAILFLIGLISSMSTGRSRRVEVQHDPETGSEIRDVEEH